MNIFFLHLYISSQVYIVISTAQTDLVLRSRTLITFSEITQAWQCLNIMFIRSDEFLYSISTSNYLLNLRYRPTTPNKDLYHTPQNHSTLTT